MRTKKTKDLLDPLELILAILVALETLSSHVRLKSHHITCDIKTFRADFCV